MPEHDQDYHKLPINQWSDDTERAKLLTERCNGLVGSIVPQAPSKYTHGWPWASWSDVPDVMKLEAIKFH